MTAMTRIDGVGMVQATPAPDVETAALLGADALAFLSGLERRFGTRRRELLAVRTARAVRIATGAEVLDFPTETAAIRAADWRVRPAPADLVDRRVEITGPVTEKLVVSALNSGANAFMADFEDATTPLWGALLTGQAVLYRAVRRTLTHRDPVTGRETSLSPTPAVLIVRPRGWHMEEAHLKVDGTAISAALFDAGLFLFHNAAEAVARGTGPYLYLPKLENRHEAALWRDVLEWVEDRLDLARGTIRVTVLIETLPAAFEMDEILHTLRDHVTGLNCGRWDYVFSMIKTLGTRPDFILPDRAQVTMAAPALAAYARLLIRTCHRRGAHAMGGMAAQIPLRDDAEGNARALARVRADKAREAGLGHDGTWVAHPGLIAEARAAFDAVMTGQNQLDRPDDGPEITAADLLQRPEGTITTAGLRTSLSVGIRYLAHWLDGRGCVALDGLMEDAATAEICRVQLWQWARHRVRTEDGVAVTATRLATEAAGLRADWADLPRGAEAEAMFLTLCGGDRPLPFLTLPAYRAITTAAA
ncbi:malate synthase A [uncultured Tistrella sp.]|nr:malate synthase A [uncultured Tistrella sp.]